MSDLENKEIKKEKKKFNIKNFKFSKIRTSFVENYDKLQANLPVLIITCISAFIIMGFLAVAIFFGNVKGPEKVLVPNVVGKPLEDALLELQVKELYPKINLRYSETPGDAGTILEQTPKAGAISKGYSRVNLVVSRGILIDSVDDFIGQQINDVILKLDTLFAGQQNPLIVLDPPEYKPDTSAAGTILEQNPPAGTSIFEPIHVQLVISRGPNYENTKAPNVVGQTVNDLMQTITRSKIVFDITAHIAEKDETPGTVVSQETIEDEFVPNYTRVSIEMAMPKKPINDNYYGIFTTQLVEYPYPVPMKLSAIPEEGAEYSILEFNHTGGNLTIPYAVPKGTTLVLTVADKVQAKQVID